MPELILSGCAPIPLAHYLKALGVLRLVSEQADPLATACWRGDQFVFESRFNRTSLAEFFLREYSPTPVLNPWNGDGGFFKDSRAGSIETLRKFSTSKSDRLRAYRATIESIRCAFLTHEVSEKPADDRKNDVLQVMRSSLGDLALKWFDAVVVLTGSGTKYPPLLGSGGNDGSIDFGRNFMQRLLLVIDPESGEASSAAEVFLNASLFQEASCGATTSDKIGQFLPGSAGGANSTAGFTGNPTANPWDYILMIEGALLFAAASLKRLESSSEGVLAFPFCVHKVGTGYDSAARADGDLNGCEIWLPLWAQPTGLKEISTIFNEGRSEFNGKRCRSGVDFARAAIMLGVDRGITAFERYALLERNGQSNFATPLGRYAVKRNAHADLLADFDSWYDRLRQKAGTQANPSPPASIARALHSLETTIFEFCRHGTPDALQKVIIALGTAERSMAGSFTWTTKDTNRLPPLSGLRPEWINAVTTDRPEFRLALALAGTKAWVESSRTSHWIRQHLEPVLLTGNAQHLRARWLDQDDQDVAWQEGPLAASLNGIMMRRHLWMDRHSADCWLDKSSRYAPLEDITAFIEGRTDDRLLADLLWGLSLVDWQAVSIADRAERAEEKDSSHRYDWRTDAFHQAVPSAFYALLKLCHRPKSDTFPAIPLTPAIHRQAAAGRGLEASRLAVRRLRASGCAPLVRELPVQADTARRTAAALLFPISPRDLRLLEKYALTETESQTTS